MHDFDALIFPAAPDIAPPGMKTGDPSFIIPFTALGGPIVSVPVAIAPQGLPLGVMLIGAPGTDRAIAVHGRALGRRDRDFPIDNPAQASERGVPRTDFPPGGKVDLEERLI